MVAKVIDKSPGHIVVAVPGSGLGRAFVYGGPYLRKSVKLVGVKLAGEVRKDCTIDFPIPNYGICDQSELLEAVAKAYALLLTDQQVYVGCVGGIGRTGLFLGVMAKVSHAYVPYGPEECGGAFDPVLFVRKHYLAHAIETSAQESLVRGIDVSGVVRWLKAFDEITAGSVPSREELPLVKRE